MMHVRSLGSSDLKVSQIGLGGMPLSIAGRPANCRAAIAVNCDTRRPRRAPRVPATRPRILIAEDHTLVREGMRQLLAEDFEVVAAVEDGRALLAVAGSGIVHAPCFILQPLIESGKLVRLLAPAATAKGRSEDRLEDARVHCVVLKIRAVPPPLPKTRKQKKVQRLVSCF